MSSTSEHRVTLVAKDGVSVVFTKVGQSAKTAAASIDQAGKSANTSADSFRRLGTSATETGAALGTVIGIVAKLGGQAETQRRQVNALDAAYGSAASQVLKYTDAIQRSTTFSNEDARQAALIAATLAQNYGFTADEVETLISVSADLAAIHGTTLTDAVQRTSSAMRGETESAESLGLTLNQQAIDHDNLTASMSNEEAAHFRLNALVDQSAYAHGEAAKATQTSAGQAAQMANAVQDITTNVGQALGPIGGLTSGLSDMALILPAAGAGLGKASEILPKLSSGAKTAGANINGLVNNITPVGAAMGGLTIAAGLLIAAWSEVQRQNGELAGSFDDLSQSVESNLSGVLQLAAQDIRFDWPIDEQNAEIIKQRGAISQLNGEMAEWNLSTDEQANANRLMAESIDLVSSQAAPSLIAVLGKLETGQEHVTISGKDVLNVLGLINDALDTQGPAAEKVAEKVDLANQKFAAGIITLPEYRSELNAIVDSIPELAAQADAATGSVVALNSALAKTALDRAALGQSAPVMGFGSTTHTLGTREDAAAEQARNRKEREAEAVQAAQDAVEERSKILQKEADDAAQAYQEMVDEAQRAAEQRADAEDRLNEQLADSTRQRVAAQKAAERDYAKEVRSIQGERVDQERALAQELRGIEQQRQQIAEDTESKLKDLAEQRSDVQREAAEKAADAESEWMQAQRDSVRAQAQVRSELQRTTAEAAREWHELQAQNAQQLRELKADLQDSLKSDKIDFNRNIEDNQTAQQRVKQDLAYDLADPNLTENDRYQLELDAARELADLQKDEARLRQDQRRAEKDAAQELRNAKKEAATEEKNAKKDYRAEVADATKDAQSQIKDIRSDQAAAHKEFMTEQADAAAKTEGLLADIDSKQRDVMADQAIQFAELESKKRTTLRDSAIAQRILARETAQAERGYQHDNAIAQRDEAKDARDAQRDYADAIKDLPDKATTNLLVDDKEARPKLRDVQGQLKDIRSGAEAEVTVVVKQADRAQSSIDKAAKPRNTEKVETTTTVSNQIVNISANTKDFEAGIARANQMGSNWANGAYYVGNLLLQKESFDRILQDAQADGEAFAGKSYTAYLKASGEGGNAQGSGGQSSGNFFTNLRNAKEAGEEFQGSTYTTYLKADISDVDTQLAKVKTRLDGLSDDESNPPKIAVAASLTKFWTTINELNGDIVATVWVNVKGRPDTAAAAAGFALGGVIGHRPIPAAAMGRTVQVGEWGTELVTLPYGSLVTPHGAAQARMREDAKSAPVSGPVFHAPVTFQMMTADVAKEVARQLRQRGIG